MLLKGKVFRSNVTEYEDIQEAMEIVRNEGFEEGFEKGRSEGRLEIAINCLQGGLSVETVSKITKLSIEKIEEHKLKIII